MKQGTSFESKLDELVARFAPKVAAVGILGGLAALGGGIGAAVVESDDTSEGQTN